MMQSCKIKKSEEYWGAENASWLGLCICGDFVKLKRTIKNSIYKIIRARVNNAKYVQ